MAISQHCHIIYQQLHYHSIITAISNKPSWRYPQVSLPPAHPLRHQPSNKAREAHVTELHVALPRAKAAKGAPKKLGDVNLGETQTPHEYHVGAIMIISIKPATNDI